MLCTPITQTTTIPKFHRQQQSLLRSQWGAVTASQSGSDDVNLSWDAIAGASGYMVVAYRGLSYPTFTPTNGVSYTTGSQTGGEIIYIGSSTSYTDVSASTSSANYYHVYVYNASDTYSNASEARMSAICSSSSSFSHGGHCYRLFTSNLNWSNAKTACTDRGGYLTSITDSSENTVIDNNVSADTWIGLNDIASESNWIWESSESYSYDNFAGGEPSNSWGNEDCVVIRTSGQWNDANCSDSKDYMCEAEY